MKKLLNAAVLVVTLVVFAPALLAQWPDYPGAKVPRTADGKPNLTAPTPRTADGKPDLSGMWTNARGGGGGAPRGGGGGAPRGGGGGAPAAANAAPGGAPAAPAAAAGPRGGGAGGPRGGGGGTPGAANAAQAGAPATPAGPPNASFGNLGSGFRGGLPLQPWAAELVRKRVADNSKDNPDAHCLPMGFMQFHTHPQPRKIVQTPEMTLIIYEANSGLRQIFTDGRPLPKGDPQPWWYGYSVGKWEGDTLVVETIGFTDDIWLDVNGNPLTGAGKVIERFRRPNYGTLEIEVTIDDPKAYTAPFTVKVNQTVMPDTELIEFICEERDATHYVGAAGPAK